MKTKNTGILMDNRVFGWIALGTVLLLLIPFSLMNFKIPLYDPGSGYEVINWTLFDFIVMGMLLFGTSSLFVLAARKIQKKHRLVVGIAFVLFFFWLWIELAVGLFTNWGS